MQSMNYAVQQEHPEVLMIVEDSTIASGVTKPVEHGGHGFDYKWDLGCTSHMMKYFRAPYNRRSDKYGDLTYPMLYHHTENFLLPLCHDEVVQDAFPDGVIWVTIGRENISLTEKMLAVGQALGDPIGHYQNETAAINRLRTVRMRQTERGAT